MQMKLADGDLFPRGLARVSLLGPCPVCNHRYMDNYPPKYPVWSESHTNLICRECWEAKSISQEPVIENAGLMRRVVSKELPELDPSDMDRIRDVIQTFATIVQECFDVLEILIYEDSKPCQYDVSGYCNTHHWKRNDGCPVGRAQQLVYWDAVE